MRNNPFLSDGEEPETTETKQTIPEVPQVQFPLRQAKPAVETAALRLPPLVQQQPILPQPAAAQPLPQPVPTELNQQVQIAQPPAMRSFGDVRAARTAIFDSVHKAASALPPVENNMYSLHLSDVHYAEKEDPTPDEIKRTLLERGTIAKTLKGTWQVTNKLTGQQTSRTGVVARVPYMLDNGTFLREGTKYILRNQSRLLPGIYTRRRDNGEIESHINTDMREGTIHHYGLDPSTGQLNLLVSGTKTPLYVLAKSMGATEEEMVNAWGKDIHDVNKKAYKEAHISKLYDKLARGQSADIKEPQAKMEALRQSLEKVHFDPDVMQLTLGKPYTNFNKEVLLETTKKLIAVSRDEQEGDDRDNMSFQEIYGPEDIFAERVAKDAGSSRRQLLNMLAFRYGGDASKIPAGVLTKQLDAAILTSGLGGNPEEINPLEILDKGYSVTKLGVGGVPSRDAIPNESRSLHPSHRGFMDPARTPESENVGVETYVATAALKGSDRQLYAPVWDKEGKEHYLRPRDIYTKTIAMQSEYNKAGDNDLIAVSKFGKESLVNKKDVDYTIPHFENAFSPLANLIPFKSATQGNRVCMGARMFQQAVPLLQGEAPLVQTGMPGKPDRSYYEEYADRGGAIFSEAQGTVVEATDDHILINTPEGEKKKIYLHRNLPSNRKTAVTQSPVVTIGQQINKGDILAKSNITDDKGAIAPGLNARVVMVPWKGLNYEDAFLISESFAKRMTSEHMYQHQLDWTKEHRQGRHAFMGIFPSTYNKEQLATIDDAGVIQVGTKVKQGDPLILAARENDPNGKKSKNGKRRLYADASVTWDHEDDGVVTDVYHKEGKGTVVLVKTESQMREGDKMCFDEATEVLTSEGWKPIAEVTREDMVACLNNDKLTYEHPYAIHQYPKGGKMYRLDSGRVDLFVTQNHRMYVREHSSQYADRYLLYEAHTIFGKTVTYKKDAKWYVEGDGAIAITPELSFTLKQYCMLLGAYLSGGTTVIRPVQGVQFYIANVKKRKELAAGLRQAGIAVTEEKRGGKTRITAHSEELAMEFRNYGVFSWNKKIPPFVFTFSKEILEELFQWLLWGGSYRGIPCSRSYSTASKLLADGIQQLCLHTGRAADITKKTTADNDTYYSCSILTDRVNPTINYRNHGKTKAWTEELIEDYKKPVYCISVTNHVIYVRRNGKAVWCGNSNRYGNKGVVRILPDDEMPTTADGMVAEVALSPGATVSRGNPAQLAELALGKIAMVTGKAYKVTDFEDIEDIPEFVDQELKKYGVDPDSPLIDKKTGQEVRNDDGSGVANGSMWFMRLHHTAENKGSARAIGTYDANETPARGGEQGSKRMAQMHLNALVSHGAYNTFMDAKYNRGQANEDFWLQYMQGGNPQTRKIPLVYEKFENSLRASGINVRPSEDRLNVMAMTDQDVTDLAGDREVSSGETIRWEKDKTPIGGGLFDPTIFGMDGTRWGKMTPVVPLLNPVMEEPARILLGLKQAEMKAVISGQQTLGKHGTGMQAVQSALKEVNVPLAMNNARSQIEHGNLQARERAIRTLGYLKGCEKTGIHPKDWMLSKIPIIPPRFRPVSEMKGSNVPLVDDANYLYKVMLDSNNSLKEFRKITKNTAKEEGDLYEAYKQVTGLADPTHPKLVQKQVRGLLRHVFGNGSSKFSMVQRNLLGVPTDTVARGVIVPDGDLDLDSVGIPEEKAWEIYKPHIVHNLTKRGMPWALAANAIEERKDIAKEALLKEMEVRPVLFDRAPVLHKWGIHAFRPKLVKGDAIRINSFVQKGFSADHDGDAMNISAPYSEEAIKEAYELLLPSKSLIKSSDMKSPMHKISSENAGGLYLASLPPDKKKQTRTFVSWADAKRAYQNGELAIDEPVTVLSSKSLPKR
jgi:DNA-directed RNA polymerase beta subunit